MLRCLSADCLDGITRDITSDTRQESMPKPTAFQVSAHSHPTFWLSASIDHLHPSINLWPLATLLPYTDKLRLHQHHSVNTFSSSNMVFVHIQVFIHIMVSSSTLWSHIYTLVFVHIMVFIHALVPHPHYGLHPSLSASSTPSSTSHLLASVRSLFDTPPVSCCPSVPSSPAWACQYQGE